MLKPAPDASIEEFKAYFHAEANRLTAERAAEGYPDNFVWYLPHDKFNQFQERLDQPARDLPRLRDMMNREDPFRD